MSLKDFGANLPLVRISEYSSPKKIVFGVGSVEASLASETKNFGKSIGLIADKGVRKAGLVDKVNDLLRKEGLDVSIYDEISAEPTSDVMRKAVEFGREGKYDAIVAIGGGSVMDTGKMVAACITNPGDLMTLVHPTVDKVKIHPKPKIMIPTTAGTGSEVSPDAVMIEGMYKTFASSPNLFAEVAIVDPLMTLTCPPRQTAISALDALSHNVETLTSTYSNPISDCQALEGSRLVFTYARRAYNDGDDLEARWGMSCAAMLGGIVIGYPWIKCLFLGHCVAEAAGPKWRIPHGAACGLVLPYTLDFNLSACVEKIARLAQFTGSDVCGLSGRKRARIAIDEIVGLLKDLELPLSLNKWGVPRKEIGEFADYIFEERQQMYLLPKFNPRKLTKDNTRELLERMYEGTIGGS